MKATFLFPDIGEGLEEGIIQEWLVEVGQEVELDTPLVTVETDKVVTDLPSPYKGVVTKLHGAVGEEIHVGNVIVEFQVEGDENDSQQKAATTSERKEIVEEEGAGVVGEIEVAGENDVLPASSEEETSTVAPEEKVLATPVVRAMARVLDVDLKSVKGSGSQGRVYKDDLEKHMNQLKQAPSEDLINKTKGEEIDLSGHLEIKPVSSLRKTIAANMLKAKQEAAHVSVFEEIEISKLESLRQTYKQEVESLGGKLTYLSFVVKAVTLALQEFRILNAKFEGSSIVYSSSVHIGLAVDTEKGLVVPVIRNTEQKSIIEIALEILQLSQKARDSKLTINDMKGGTFTITSFGSVGGRFGTPILNRPQSGILGIGRVGKQPIVVDDKVDVGLVMPLSLTVDHCIVDGGDSSRFLTRVMQYLNDPIRMVIGGGKGS